MTTAAAIAATGANAVDSLLSGTAWVSTPGTPLSLTYSFAATDSWYTAMTAVEQAATRAALSLWSAVAHVTFTEVSDTGGGGTLRFATSNQGACNILASTTAIVPGSTQAVVSLNNVCFNDQGGSQSFAPGSFGFASLVHEIGHALGLKHPGNYDGSVGDGNTGGPFLPAATDSTGYSVMSYNHAAGSYGYSTGPMLYDIAAVQYLYGANTASAGNHTYSFASTVPGLQCIWDAGPNNTIDATACTGAVTINLTAGSFSTIGTTLIDSYGTSPAPTPNDISLAAGTHIRFALAGSGGSTITGNNDNDTLTGGGGNDTFYVDGGGSAPAAGGNTIIIGNGGADTVVFHDARANYTIVTDATGHVIVTETGGAGGDGTTTASGIATLRFADSSLAVSSLTSQPPATLTNATVTNTSGSQATLLAPNPNTTVIGAGSDMLSLSGNASTTYSVVANGDGSVALTSAAGSDHVSGVCQIQFSDKTITLANSDQANVARLYQAAFGRSPDGPGLAAWENVYAAVPTGAKTAGTTTSLALTPVAGLPDIAYGFTNSAEFQGRYGTLGNADFLTRLYQNVLGRTADQAGYNAWLSAMNTGGYNKEMVLVGFAESAENVAGTSYSAGHAAGWLFSV